MYCGGNVQVEEGSSNASSVRGQVIDPSGEVIPDARVQVEIRGQKGLLKDERTDKRGRFHLALKPGQYWLGISYPGFNLHYWRLTVSHAAGPVQIKVGLTFGT